MQKAWTLRGGAVFLGLAMVLGGCNPDSADVTRADGKPFTHHLIEGEKVDVKVKVLVSELEGSTSFFAESLESTDEKIVATEIGGHGFYLVAVAPGTATIHVATDTYHSANFVVTVDAAPLVR